jgi:hypothetical protein
MKRRECEGGRAGILERNGSTPRVRTRVTIAVQLRSRGSSTIAPDVPLAGDPRGCETLRELGQFRFAIVSAAAGDGFRFAFDATRFQQAGRFHQNKWNCSRQIGVSKRRSAAGERVAAAGVSLQSDAERAGAAWGGRSCGRPRNCVLPRVTATGKGGGGWNVVGKSRGNPTGSETFGLTRAGSWRRHWAGSVACRLEVPRNATDVHVGIHWQHLLQVRVARRPIGSQMSDTAGLAAVLPSGPTPSLRLR